MEFSIEVTTALCPMRMFAKSREGRVSFLLLQGSLLNSNVPSLFVVVAFVCVCLRLLTRKKGPCCLLYTRRHTHVVGYGCLVGSMVCLRKKGFSGETNAASTLCMGRVGTKTCLRFHFFSSKRRENVHLCREFSCHKLLLLQYIFFGETYAKTHSHA